MELIEFVSVFEHVIYTQCLSYKLPSLFYGKFGKIWAWEHCRMPTMFLG